MKKPKPADIVFIIIVILGALYFFSPFKPSYDLVPRLYPDIPVYDTHEHMDEASRIYEFENIMKEAGVVSVSFLGSPQITFGYGYNFSGYAENNLELLKLSEKSEYFTFCTVDTTKLDALNELKTYLESGGTGLKLYNGHMNVHPIMGQINSSELDEIYSFVEDNKIPVIFHVDLFLYFDEFNNAMKKHPNMTVNIPHLGEDALFGLKNISFLLDNYPNTYTDISFGIGLSRNLGAISKSPEAARNFIIKYQDRILFGLDLVVNEENKYIDSEFILKNYFCYFNLLEQKDFYCEPYDRFANQPGFKKNKLNGLNLDKEVLQKIYYDNPRKFLGTNS
ncbi:amidohydrolase family protein [Bacteroidota bacterium]